MILLIDNYDSFTFNIYQAFSALGYPIKVLRNDKTSLEEIQALNPSYIILGPGPKAPKDSKLNIAIVQNFKGIYPILGICLGHQAILAAFGVEIVNAKNIIHGKVEPLIHNEKGVFRHISQKTPIVRYHSLVGKKDAIPECFMVSAVSEDGEVMAVEHKQYHLVGLQFHPESIGTKEGIKMLQNFLHYARELIPVKEYLKKTLKQESLNFQESYNLMDELTEGNLSDAQIGSVLTSLEIKGVNAYELAGFASVLKQKAVRFTPKRKFAKNFDMVGTGGSNAKTFNVSTTCALLLASMARAENFGIIKHGNGAITSKSGAADLLNALGIPADMKLQNALKAYEELHITFLFAQRFHAAMRFAAPARKTLGFKTAFNLIGPLSNPASISHQLIGVFDKGYTEIMAQALQILGIKRAMVVSGLEGYDEISLCAPTQITELKEGSIKTYIFNPIEVGLSFVPYAMLKGGDVRENLAITQDIFNALESPKLNLVALNMGAALYVCDLADSIKEGFFRAKEIIKSGAVFGVLESFQKISNAHLEEF
ncbi:bifunctional anthranilate synthase component II/anthranilate phosphoribosyltransferase [Helicobacter sp.]|uniref:bifunctional anthranilate synthase component II/anthranilate phosphoribosyltransferase n=1 Tax=Helicobacter sp. TaxID=218 RepID=UPI0025BE510E|nr:bifunctional anthranilate synthase component II/anthranilate phosphoribosyltransferase [Helicobacter sp.]MCI5969292.1 bifunctional anthranilate synthase component II/anthranilate phosphoribosyltransferase [Helicobacter sp.]MDY2585546.1 bifunctional anthranilate synthase component II/anthranilate phosphoribosyltransferase [Helicobacter sp.]